MIKTLIVAASIIAFSGAVMATEVPKAADTKAKCVATATVKCPVEPAKKPETKKTEEKKPEAKKTN